MALQSSALVSNLHFVECKQFTLFGHQIYIPPFCSPAYNITRLCLSRSLFSNYIDPVCMITWHFLPQEILNLTAILFFLLLPLYLYKKKQQNIFAFLPKLSSSYGTQSYKLCIRLCLAYVCYKLIDNLSTVAAWQKQMGLKQLLVSVCISDCFFLCFVK